MKNDCLDNPQHAHYIEHTLYLLSDDMINNTCLASTNHQIVYGFLAKNSDKDYYEREIARRTGISYGSANRVLNDLHAQDYIMRQDRGKLSFYTVNQEDPAFRYYKIFFSIYLIRPLIIQLIPHSYRIILFGSCARGEDSSQSDIDLFIVSGDKVAAVKTCEGYSFRKGFENILIEPVIYSPDELIDSEKIDQKFLSLIKEGITLWEKTDYESRL